MKVKVDRDLCIGVSNCVAIVTCPPKTSPVVMLV